VISVTKNKQDKLLEKAGNHHMHCCLKCLHIKNVLAAFSDIDTFFIVQGDLRKQTGSEKQQLCADNS
jgi:hypothetical protein